MTNNSPKDNNGSSNESPPASIPQTTPKGIGYGHPEYQFVQSIMEMQKSLGEINASIQALNKSVDSSKSKIDDLVKWKNMIVGGALAIGFIIGLLSLISTKVLNHITFNTPTTPQTIQSAQPEQK